MVGRHGVGRGQRGLRLDEGAERTRRVRVAADRRLEERPEDGRRRAPRSRAPQAAQAWTHRASFGIGGAARATARQAPAASLIIPRRASSSAMAVASSTGRAAQRSSAAASCPLSTHQKATAAQTAPAQASPASSVASCSSSANASSPPMIRSRHARSTFPAASAQAWIGAPCAASWAPCRTMSRHACGACSCSQSWMSRRFAAATSCSGAFGWWSWAQVSQMALCELFCVRHGTRRGDGVLRCESLSLGFCKLSLLCKCLARFTGSPACQIDQSLHETTVRQKCARDSVVPSERSHTQLAS